MLALLTLLAADQPWGIHLSAALVTALVGGILPLLVGLITKYEAHPGLKGVLLAILAAVAGLIVNSALDDGSAFISQQGLTLAIGAFATGVIAHFGLWRPTTIAEKVGRTPGALG